MHGGLRAAARPSGPPSIVLPDAADSCVVAPARSAHGGVGRGDPLSGRQHGRSRGGSQLLRRAGDLPRAARGADDSRHRRRGGAGLGARELRRDHGADAATTKVVESVARSATHDVLAGPRAHAAGLAVLRDQRRLRHLGRRRPGDQCRPRGPGEARLHPQAADRPRADAGGDRVLPPVGDGRLPRRRVGPQRLREDRPGDTGGGRLGLRALARRAAVRTRGARRRRSATRRIPRRGARAP